MEYLGFVGEEDGGAVAVCLGNISYGADHGIIPSSAALTIHQQSCAIVGEFGGLDDPLSVQGLSRDGHGGEQGKGQKERSHGVDQ